MFRYVANRLLLAIPTLIGVAIITFFVLRVVPGDIVEAKLRGDGAQVTVDVIERERARLGLDKPLSEQFVDWMKGLARFDLGNSMWTGRPVIEEVAARFRDHLPDRADGDADRLLHRDPARHHGSALSRHMGRYRGAHVRGRGPRGAELLARHADHPRACCGASAPCRR